jgi:hypothetical protein
MARIASGRGRSFGLWGRSSWAISPWLRGFATDHHYVAPTVAVGAGNATKLAAASVSRRAHARKARTSINGTPEERAAKFVPSKKSEPRKYNSNPLRAKLVAVSRAATIAGRVNYQSRDLSRIGPLGERHSQELRSAAKEALYLASEFERAAGQLEPSQRCVENHQSTKAEEARPMLVKFLQKLRAYFVQEIATGKEVDRIFDDLEGSYSSFENALDKNDRRSRERCDGQEGPGRGRHPSKA